MTKNDIRIVTIVCKQCGKELKGKKGKKGYAGINKAKSYNDYYFCPDTDCLSLYLKEEKEIIK